MIVSQRLIGFNNLCQIRLHEFRNHVYLIETFSIFWLENSFDAQHIFVL